MKNVQLYTIVSISGAAVLAIEILGTRILGPFYGVSLFLWSALISVTLAALGFGYILGGYWADRRASYTILGTLLWLAGLWLLVLPWLKHLVLSLEAVLGLRLAVLVAAFILFFPPLALLGMVSPYAIKLKTDHLSKVGRSAGTLTAISTFASVISALLTGFFLIPIVGVRWLTFGIAVLLIGTGLVTTFKSRKSRLVSATTLSSLLFVALVGWQLPVERPDPATGLLFIQESPYAEIKVVDKNEARYLLIDGGVHTMIDRANGGTMQRYAAAMDLVKNFFGSNKQLLIIGLGGGAIAKSFAMDGWQVDAVEIDPVVIKVAKQYFSLQDFECRIYQMDGRQFLLTHPEKYDLIIMDAFGSSSIPFHLITSETFRLVQNHLKSKGIFAINIESVGWDSKLVQAVSATLKLSFNNLLVLPTSEPPNSLGNLVILASDREYEFPEEWLGRPVDYVDVDPYQHWVVVQRNHAWDNRFVPEATGSSVLTDDLNPVDIWSEQVNLNSRKLLHQVF